MASTILAADIGADGEAVDEDEDGAGEVEGEEGFGVENSTISPGVLGSEAEGW